MSLTQFLLALRARYKIVFLILLLTVAAAAGVSSILPKSYVATSSLVVNYKGVDPVTGLSLPAQLMPGYIATQVDIIKSKGLALKVVDDLKLTEKPQLQKKYKEAEGGEPIRDWIADLLVSKLGVVPARDSSVLNISFKGEDPHYVAAVANGFAAAYLQFSVQLKTEPAQQASGYINTQIQSLREQFEQAQNKLSEYQKKHNIYNADNRVDVETTRLNDLSTQLVQVQGLAMEAASRQRQVQGNASESPDVQNNVLIQTLQSNLAAAEAKFGDTSKRYSANHPQYIAAKSEVDKMRANLDEQIRATSAGIVSNARIYQQREAELRSALNAQKSKVLALNSARDEFNLLTNEVDNARRAYEAATLRFNQTSLEGKSKQADNALLTAATVPNKPSSPKMLINVLIAAVAGLILGIGAALVIELLDQRVRSAGNLGELFGLPVLGVIEKSRGRIRKRAEPVLSHKRPPSLFAAKA